MNLQAAFDQFMEVRMNGLVPSQEMYEHFFSIVAVWGDNEAMDLLLEEMDKLGYQKGQVIDTNLVMRAVTEGETEVAEKLFEEMRKKKYDIPEKYYNIMLMYYSRIALDFEKAWALYGAMRKDNVIVGPNPGNVLLDLCRIDKNWDRAEELFEEMLRCGDLTSDKSKDFDTLVFETTTYKSFPKLHTITDTYLLMTEIYCEKGDLQKAEEFLQKTRETIKLAERKNNALHTRFYTSLMQLYLQNKQYDKVQKTLEEVLESGTYPPLIIWKKAFQAVLRKNNPKEVIKFNEEFENHGYEFDEELSGELIDFWASVKDYRRAKNTYDSLLKLGILPSDEARSAIIKVYAVAGYEGEVQRFYEDQVRTGRRITASMHEVMVDDFLKRGYPGSARQVLVRMEVDGLYPTAGVIAKVVSGYADVGGSKQIGELFKQYFTGPEAKLSMTGEMLAAAVKGCIKDSDVNYALDLWEKYSRRILLTYDVAEALIYNFAQLKALETAFEIYKRLKSERQFKPDDPSSLFDTILSVANTAEKCRAVLQDMRDSFIPISTDSIRAVLTNPEVVVDLPFVLEIVKIYITEAFPGPYEREIFMLFFGLVEKYDYGRFKAEARAWLQRLSPPRPDGVFILDSNKKDESLLTSRVSLLLSKYILAIDTTQFVIPAANKKPLDALFTGSILDVEDLLVHKYGFDPTAVRQLLGDDKEEVAMREYLKGLDKKIEESQKKDNRAEE
uniref:Pentacotripeptide-repeat region of PRORP domain-containing protein n=1 Tax=Arcella intermedia TaxID=1963864 RepID=A0A6B2KYT0_9EUKA